MKARKFNSLMCYHNHKWCAEALIMNINENIGPDLIDKFKFVELKFTLVNAKENNNNNPRAWTVLENQVGYEQETKLKGYWGLGIYELNKSVKNISGHNLEKFVLSRKLYLVDWNWIDQFKSYHTFGKTDFSEWDCYLRYPKYERLPKTILTHKVNKGKIHFTSKSQLEHFRGVINLLSHSIVSKSS